MILKNIQTELKNLKKNYGLILLVKKYVYLINIKFGGVLNGYRKFILSLRLKIIPLENTHPKSLNLHFL